MYRPLRLEDVGDVNSSLCVDEFQPAGRGVLDPRAVPVCVCARVRPCASGRDTRVVLLSGGTDGTLGGGGGGRGTRKCSSRRDWTRRGGACEWSAQPRERDTRGAHWLSRRARAPVPPSHLLHVTSDGSGGTDTSG